MLLVTQVTRRVHILRPPIRIMCSTRDARGRADGDTSSEVSAGPITPKTGGKELLGSPVDGCYGSKGSDSQTMPLPDALRNVPECGQGCTHLCNACCLDSVLHAGSMCRDDRIRYGTWALHHWLCQSVAGSRPPRFLGSKGSQWRSRIVHIAQEWLRSMCIICIHRSYWRAYGR